MASRVVIASAVRTPFTRALKGEFKDTRPDTLAAEGAGEGGADGAGDDDSGSHGSGSPN